MRKGLGAAQRPAVTTGSGASLSLFCPPSFLQPHDWLSLQDSGSEGSQRLHSRRLCAGGKREDYKGGGGREQRGMRWPWSWPELSLSLCGVTVAGRRVQLSLSRVT
jgi:hypothetical protein